MNLFTRLLASVAGGFTRPASTEARLWTEAVGLDTRSGVHVTARKVLQLDAVQGCLENIGGPISSLPWGVFERKRPAGGAAGEGGDAREPKPDHPLGRLLNQRPNARQTSQEFWDEQMRHLAFYRNCYAVIVPGADGAPIGALEPYHPNRLVKIERAPDGAIYYTFSGLGTGAQERYRSDEVLHIRRAPLTEDGLRGEPVYETSPEVFGRAIAVRDFGGDYFRNGGSGGGILEHPGSFKTKEDREAFIEAWRAMATGPNRHKDRLLTHGTKYNRLEVKNNEAQFIETEKLSDLRIARLWNMPPHRIGVLDRATLSNIEQQSLDFVMYTLAPYICAAEEAVERDLLVGDDEQSRLFVEINVAGLLRGDLKGRFEAYKMGREGGWLSVNDIRRLENMNPIDGGDRYLEPLNMRNPGDPT